MSLNADERSIKTGIIVHPYSEGKEFHVMAATTANDRRPTAGSQTDYIRTVTSKLENISIHFIIYLFILFITPNQHI